MSRRTVLAIVGVVLAVLAGPHTAAVAMTAAPPAGLCLMTAALVLRCRRLAREGVLWWG